MIIGQGLPWLHRHIIYTGTSIIIKERVWFKERVWIGNLRVIIMIGRWDKDTLSYDRLR